MKKKKKIRDKKEEEERKPQRGRNPGSVNSMSATIPFALVQNAINYPI